MTINYEWVKNEWIWVAFAFLFLLTFFYNPLNWGDDLIIIWVLLSFIGLEIAKTRRK